MHRHLPTRPCSACSQQVAQQRSQGSPATRRHRAPPRRSIFARETANNRTPVRGSPSPLTHNAGGPAVARSSPVPAQTTLGMRDDACLCCAAEQVLAAYHPAQESGRQPGYAVRDRAEGGGHEQGAGARRGQGSTCSCAHRTLRACPCAGCVWVRKGALCSTCRSQPFTLQRSPP